MSKSRAILASYVGVLAYSAFIFLGAWRLSYWQGLLYVVLALVGVTLNHLLVRAQSVITVERASRVGAGEDWDRRILGAYFLVSVVAFVTAGLDSGRFGWSGRVPPQVTYGGVALMLAGQVLFALAKRENDFFSSTAAIQTERGHRVCETGPYRFVRHPGYLGMHPGIRRGSSVDRPHAAGGPLSHGAAGRVRAVRHEDQMATVSRGVLGGREATGW